MTLRVAVCVPSHGEWTSATGWSIAKMVECFVSAQYDGEKAINLFSVTGSLLLDNRHKLVAEAFKWDATHILWVDSDMMFPHDTIQAFLRHGKMVVGANYVRRALPTMPTAYVESEDYIGPLYTGETDTGLVEVRHCGLGLMLCHMDVFEAIEMPFFAMPPIPPHNIRVEGEDVFFCKKLAKAGIKVHVDQDVSKMVKHCGQYEFEHKHALISRQVNLDMHEKKKDADRDAFLKGEVPKEPHE